MKSYRLICLYGLAALLVGCAGMGGSDQDIQQGILDDWTAHHSANTNALGVTVSQGIVDLTGTLDSAQDRIDALRDAWKPDGVIEVVNQLQISEKPTKTARRDRESAIKMRTRLTFDTDIASTHYSIEAMDGTIYLMGYARDEAELARVKQLAEDTTGEGKVVSYVEIRPATN